MLVVGLTLAVAATGCTNLLVSKGASVSKELNSIQFMFENPFDRRVIRNTIYTLSEIVSGACCEGGWKHHDLLQRRLWKSLWQSWFLSGQ